MNRIAPALPQSAHSPARRPRIADFDWITWLVMAAGVVLFGTVGYLYLNVAMMDDPPEVVFPAKP